MPLARFFLVQSTQLSEIQRLLPYPHGFVETAFFGKATNARQMRPCQGFAEKRNGTGVRRRDAVEHPQQRGLARAVGAKQTEDA